MQHSLKPVFFTIVLLIVLCSCKDEKGTDTAEDITAQPEVKEYIEVVTTGMNFDLVDTIPSGWTTFRYSNKSLEPHFFIFEKMPDTLGIASYKRELVPPFIAAFHHFEAGDVDAAMKEFEKIPEWFYRVELSGGVALTSPETTTESTLYLEPGTYVMECYVRMPNGMAHALMGMLKQLVVVDGDNENPEPKADYQIEVSSAEGIAFVDSLAAGKYTLAVHFLDQKKYEHMLGHDVNLVKIDHDSLVKPLGEWLNTANLQAFRSPAPEGLTFLGGVEDLPERNRGFFTVELTPGNYVLISEIPQAIERKMYTPFTVH